MSKFGCNKQIKDPSGSWDYEQLIGAKVQVKSLQVSNFFNCFNSSDICTIKNIFFRISLDGKVITVVELDQHPGKVFIWRDLQVLELSSRYRYNAMCGEFLCGQTITGYNVDKEQSQPTESSEGGVSLIDDKGNIISNRYIRIVGADVEDPNTDTNNITDINVNLDGDILD